MGAGNLLLGATLLDRQPGCVPAALFYSYAMTPAPERRWLRYSLRTLLVVVTAFGGWLGYESSWIRQRRAFLDRFRVQIERPQEPSLNSRHDYWKRGLERHDVSGLPPLKPVGARAVLWVFREPQIRDLTMTVHDTDDWSCQGGNFGVDVLEPSKRLFPETTIHATFIQRIR